MRDHLVSDSRADQVPLFSLRAWGGSSLGERFTSSTTSGGSHSSSSGNRTLSCHTSWRPTEWGTHADQSSFCCPQLKFSWLNLNFYQNQLIAVDPEISWIQTKTQTKTEFCWVLVSWTCTDTLLSCLTCTGVCFRAELALFRWSFRPESSSSCCSANQAAQTDGRCTGEDLVWCNDTFTCKHKITWQGHDTWTMIGSREVSDSFSIRTLVS